MVGKAVGQFLENLVRLRSKVVIDGAALPRESHDQELCPAQDDRSSKPEMISLVCRLRWFRMVVRWLVKTARVGDGVRNGGPEAPWGALINARSSLTSVTRCSLNTRHPTSGRRVTAI